MLMSAGFLGGVDFLYISVISTWLSICVVYLCIDNLGKNRKRLLNDVIAFTIVVLSILAGTVVFFLSETIATIENNFTFLLYALMISFVVELLCIYLYFRKKFIRFLSIFIISFVFLSIYILLMIFNVDFYYVAIISVLLYLILTITATIVLNNRIKSKYISGLLYTMVVTIVLLAVLGISQYRNPDFIAFMEFVLTLGMALSFFIFYGQTYSKFLNEKEEIVKMKADLLEEAEKKIISFSLINQDTKIKNIHKFEYDIDTVNKDAKNAMKITHLLMLNLDNYRVMYNTMGYKKAINTMISVAGELRKVIGKKGELYHISNDKFIISLNCSNEECGMIVREVLTLFTEHEFFAINLKPYVGFTNVESRQLNYESILKELELASETAKDNDVFYAAYNYDMYKRVQRRIGMENVLRSACENQTWELYLQPKVSTKNNMIVGAEGLIRWKGQEGKISPAQFIPLAEEMGLIVDIGKTIIEKGFRYAKTIADALKPDFVLAVNLSAYQLMRTDFVQYVLEMVDKFHTNPKNITFEITETSFIDNMDRVRNAILQLREHGFHFSLDDFGTGYSSIGYLSKFELDEVKFDKDFTSGIYDSKNRIILETVTMLAQKLGYHIVTEGIETQEQLELVREIGCEIYQGYLFSKPVSFEDFMILLKKNINGEKV